MLYTPDQGFIVSETCSGSEIICKGEACVKAQRSFVSLHKQDEKKKNHLVTHLTLNRHMVLNCYFKNSPHFLLSEVACPLFAGLYKCGLWVLNIVEWKMLNNFQVKYLNNFSFWLQIQRSRVRFPALPDFLRSMGSGTGSTQPREDNWAATWKKK
jgi:hypothetical protein